MDGSHKNAEGPIRALIADDEAFIRQVLQKMLERIGVEVVGAAENGQEAVRLYETLRPDVVIMDIAMPIMDGLAAVESIMDLDPEAKVLMCTSFSSKHYVVEAVKLGARGYLNKPFDLEKIREKVSKICSPGPVAST